MPDIRDTIDEIVMWHRDRCFFMEQRKRGHLALASNLRTRLGWSPALPEKERKAISKRALDLVKTGREHARAMKADKPFDCDEPDYLRFETFILAALAGDAHAEANERIAEKNMERLAVTLPVWEAWAKDVYGFGAKGLAVIVGEAGDLSGYATHSKLWKRMGVAVMGDVRQGGLGKGASADEWVAHGYSPQRRSRLFTIGDALIKATGGDYRAVYIARLRREHAKAIEEGLIPATTVAGTVQSWAERGLPPLEKVAKIDPARHRSAGHMARRAQRYMEKRLLRDLWGAWRRAKSALPQGAVVDVPAADRDAA
jgi:hypothetical protein